MAFLCLILLGLFVHTQTVDLSDDVKLEHLVVKHCERYVNVKIEGIQDKHDAEIATLKSEMAKSKTEMDVMKTELEKQRKQIETLRANTDQSTRVEHFSDSRETLTAIIDQSTRTEHLSDSPGILAANITQSTRTEHLSDSRETLTANTEKSNKLQHLLNSTTEVPVAKIDRQNKPEPESDSVAKGTIQSGKTLSRESGSKVVETRNIDDHLALPSKGVRIRRDVHRVAFFAYLTSHAEHLGKDKDIVFDHAVTNIGNAYSEHHGVFVAPVQGTYVFSCTLMNTENTYGHFVVNNNIVAKFYLPLNEQTSHTVVVTLNAGDDVSIKNIVTDRNIHGDRYSTFSGFLLYGSGSEEIIG